MRLLIVGDAFFLARHRQLWDALGAHFAEVDELAVIDPGVFARAAYGLVALVRGKVRPPLRPALRALAERYEKRPPTFARKSRAIARRIAALRPRPDVILHVFGMSAPRARGLEHGVPFAYLADSTMALAIRTWPAWAPYASSAERARWLALEAENYRAAIRTFAFSQTTRDSFVDDYGVAPERALAVGAAGSYDDVGPAERTYGSQRIVFNGSDWLRKGGDLVLAAFRIVRAGIPGATLTIVGNDPLPPELGVVALGSVDRTTLLALFDAADAVVAPARADPMPGFVLEAMSRGCVPVVSDVPGIASAIDDGRDGYVVPLDAETIAERLVVLLTDADLARILGRNARAKIEATWNWRAVAAQIASELHAALDAAVTSAALTKS